MPFFFGGGPFGELDLFFLRMIFGFAAFPNWGLVGWFFLLKQIQGGLHQGPGDHWKAYLIASKSAGD